MPIYKKSDKTDVSNYRPISILNVIPKLFEKIVTDYIKKKMRYILSNSQHGFVDRRSTSTNLVTFKSFLADAMEKGNQVDAIYTDFSKAFDSVSHKIHFTKLKRLGFGSSILRWIASYLSNRQQFVAIVNGADSDFISVPSGVPQGSHFGLLLSLLFINNLPDRLSYSEIILYADDAKFCKIVESPEDALFLQK